MPVLRESRADLDAAVADAWGWGPLGAETMPPFSAVRRMTKKQLAPEAAETKDGNMTPRFNCKIEMQV